MSDLAILALPFLCSSEATALVKPLFDDGYRRVVVMKLV